MGRVQNAPERSRNAQRLLSLSRKPVALPGTAGLPVIVPAHRSRLNYHQAQKTHRCFFDIKDFTESTARWQPRKSPACSTATSLR
jgi:hypothetical protein